VDTCLHHLQRETEFVTSQTAQSAALALIQEFYREKLAMMLRHQAHARLVGQYDANNTYQYIINREDVQLSWLSKAIVDFGGGNSEPLEPPAVETHSDKRSVQVLFEEDAHGARTFVERWRPRVESVTNARVKGMLQVILGETMEQKRFFEQALAGRTDLLGRRGDAAGPAQGAVLAARWVE
jgi:hypothetical protein